MKAIRQLFLAICLNSSITPWVMAGSFELAIGPSRFEISGKSGTRLGQSLEINNVGAGATELSLRTIDWHYSPEGNISYFDALQPGSCRPWVTLERRILKIPANSKANFRFQMDIPADAMRQECRFMIAIEGVEPAHSARIAGGGANLSLPVSGRIAVPVYLAVNGAEPKISISDLRHTTGQLSVQVVNNGDAHGRLEGYLEAIDGKGQSLKLTPESTPIMPGQTRKIPIAVTLATNNKPGEWNLPLKISGTLDWDKGGFKFETEIK